MHFIRMIVQTSVYSPSPLPRRVFHRYPPTSLRMQLSDLYSVRSYRMLRCSEVRTDFFIVPGTFSPKHRRLSSTGRTRRRLSDARDAATRPSYVLISLPVTNDARPFTIFHLLCRHFGLILLKFCHPDQGPCRTSPSHHLQPSPFPLRLQVIIPIITFTRRVNPKVLSQYSDPTLLLRPRLIQAGVRTTLNYQHRFLLTAVSARVVVLRRMERSVARYLRARAAQRWLFLCPEPFE